MQLRINTDGGSRGNPGPAAIGVVITDENKKRIHEHNAYLGEQTNNVAEYEALLYALHFLEGFSAITQPQKCEFFLDSKLVVEQVSGRWKVKEMHLQKYVLEAMKIMKALPYPVTLQYVPRAQNAQADALVNQALDAAA